MFLKLNKYLCKGCEIVKRKIKNNFMKTSDLKQTHTFVELPVSEFTFNEIRRKLKEANYEHTFDYDSFGEVISIDMRGIALVEEKYE